MAVANTPVVLAFVACGLLLSSEAPGPGAEPVGSTRGSLLRALTRLRGPLPGLVAVAALTGATTSVLLLYQVPTMVEAGLALTMASTLAGARGLLQLAGRLPLPPVIRRFGSGRTFVGSLGLLVVAALVLPVSGTVAVALLFVVVGGVAIGAMTTVESIFATDVVGTDGVGTSLGAMSLTRGIGGAIGPTAAGVVTATTGSRTPSLVGIAVLAVVTAFVVVAVDRQQADLGD